MTKKEPNHPVRVFSGRDLFDAELCVSFLRSEGIPASVEDPASHAVLSAMADEGGGHGVGVTVPSDRAAEAEKVLAAYRSHSPLLSEEQSNLSTAVAPEEE